MQMTSMGLKGSVEKHVYELDKINERQILRDVMTAIVLAIAVVTSFFLHV